MKLPGQDGFRKIRFVNSGWIKDTFKEFKNGKI